VCGFCFLSHLPPQPGRRGGGGPPAGRRRRSGPATAPSSGGRWTLVRRGGASGEGVRDPGPPDPGEPQIQRHADLAAQAAEEGQHFKEGEVAGEAWRTSDYRADRKNASPALETATQKLAELKRSWPEETTRPKSELAEEESNLRPAAARLRPEPIAGRGARCASANTSRRDAYEAWRGGAAAADRAWAEENGPRLERSGRRGGRQVGGAPTSPARGGWTTAHHRTPSHGTILKKNAREGEHGHPVGVASDSGLRRSCATWPDLSESRST